MRPRVTADPDKVAAERSEIQRLAFAARKSMILASRKAGGPHGAEWERWKVARANLEELARSEVPDVVAARHAYWYGRVGPITDAQASAEARQP